MFKNNDVMLKITDRLQVNHELTIYFTVYKSYCYDPCKYSHYRIVFRDIKKDSQGKIVSKGSLTGNIHRFNEQKTLFKACLDMCKYMKVKTSKKALYKLLKTFKSITLTELLNQV